MRSEQYLEMFLHTLANWEMFSNVSKVAFHYSLMMVVLCYWHIDKTFLKINWLACQVTVNIAAVNFRIVVQMTSDK